MICSGLNRFPLAIAGSFVPGQSSQSTRSKKSQSGQTLTTQAPQPALQSEDAQREPVSHARGPVTQRTHIQLGTNPQSVRRSDRSAKRNGRGRRPNHCYVVEDKLVHRADEGKK